MGGNTSGMSRRPTNMRRAITFLLLGLVACEGGGPQPPIRPPEHGRARFEFVSSWEPSIEEHNYVTVVTYSFRVRNAGVRAAAPTCRLVLDRQPLPGWSQGEEIAVGSEGRVSGEALLRDSENASDVLPRLDPRCREAIGRDPWSGVPKRFFAMEGDDAYFAMQRGGFNVSFGRDVSRAERLNIQGHRTHPEVVLTSVEREPATKNVIILDVDCVGREAELC